MEKNNALELAKKIIELDMLRDETWENLSQLVGNRAEELLRRVQNS